MIPKYKPKEKTPVIKLCKECGKEKRLPGISFCYQCKRERDVIKALQKKEKLQDQKFKEMKARVKGSLKELTKKSWKIQSQLYRMKHADKNGMVECYTCECIKHWKQMDLGHRHHSRLDFDNRNHKIQCTKCNRDMHGNLGVYENKNLENYGQEWVNQLSRDSYSKKYTCEEIKEITKKLKIELKEEKKNWDEKCNYRIN